MRWLLSTFLVVVATMLSTRGELPPYVYQELQAKSPEALTIKVESVSIVTSDESTLKRLTITAEARVEKVVRSASGLKSGDAIRINYVCLEHKQFIAGPSEPEVLQKDRSYPAFLVKAAQDQAYAPAARGFSFRSAN
ncbi:MAG: hypothetical protein QOH88_1374 [Verrucomicrobiota bacterium]|jgi:hypothetical protein